MCEFRPVPSEDRHRLAEILRYAFSPQAGPVQESDSGEWPPTLFDQRGLYEDGQLVSSCKLYYLDAFFRGSVQEIGGLGAVATPPEKRRRGYVRTLCREALESYRQNDVGVVVLWPFSTEFYEQFGWAVANTVVQYTLPPEELPTHESEGEFVLLDADDWERLRPVERTYGRGTNLSLRRSAQWWRKRTLTNWTGGTDPYSYGYERGGDLEGYLVYSVRDDEQLTLVVDDLAYTDEEAYRSLLGFLGTHGAQITQLQLTRPRDAPFLERVRTPERVESAVKIGPMARLTTVSALEGLSWPAVNLDCAVSVTDPLLDRNDGVFELSVTAGEASVRPVADQAAGVDLSVGIGTLTQLAIGTHDLDTASTVGDLSVHTDSLRNDLDSLFETNSVWLREYF